MSDELRYHIDEIMCKIQYYTYQEDLDSRWKPEYCVPKPDTLTLEDACEFVNQVNAELGFIPTPMAHFYAREDAHPSVLLILAGLRSDLVNFLDEQNRHL